MSKSEKQFFGPLTLHQKCEKPIIFKCDERSECSCVLCDEIFTLPTAEKQMLTHIFMEHRLVIADANQISNLKSYMKYWRLRFKDQNLPYFCTTMLLDKKPDGTLSKNEEYFLLSDVLPEDREIRQNLIQEKLEQLLERHTFEREDKNFLKECLFCRYISSGTRACYLNHLYEKHNFHVGKPENLVLIDNLIDLIASKLDNLQCIFCEGLFKDRTTLKEHMRKKGHKRINPANQEFDKFYLVNYIGDQQLSVKTKHLIHKPQPQTVKEDIELDSNIDSDPEWSEWTEENGPLITCLFCDHSEMEYINILKHMETQHEFSFTEATSGLDFYQKIKIVNYIRRQIHLHQCILCGIKFEDKTKLEKHCKDMKHWVLHKDKWDQPEHYFPTYEDDLFLCFIYDDDESWWSSEEQDVESKNNMSDNISKEMALAVLKE